MYIADIVILALGIPLISAASYPATQAPENLEGKALPVCHTKLKDAGLRHAAITRRRAKLQTFVGAKRASRTARDNNPAIINQTNHHSTHHYTPLTPESVIFRNRTCVLNVETGPGPYWVRGEYVRENVIDGQPGVPVILETQFIDVETCEPIVGLGMEIWSANATGVYSSIQGGFMEKANGNVNDASNLAKTFLRGVQKSDQDGVVQFTTLFPGHYHDRANHFHVIAHLNATFLPNNTVSGGTVAYAGQFFWDQNLIDLVEISYPYDTNTMPLQRNIDDGFFITETENTNSDPVLEYSFLGPDLSDGLFAWITVGLNVSASYDPNYNWSWTADGSVYGPHGTFTPVAGFSQIGDWD
ncbi:Intradiol ring-cleavage dioxygenase [Penicillium canescens]|nr:Intradiol ring-cleavage dioxygenase [Penicillium canescens]KAJ6172901.1 Intradiol ring-cleavage dioxygenase [Penicillium canescens]